MCRTHLWKFELYFTKLEIWLCTFIGKNKYNFVECSLMHVVLCSRPQFGLCHACMLTAAAESDYQAQKIPSYLLCIIQLWRHYWEPNPVPPFSFSNSLAQISVVKVVTFVFLTNRLILFSMSSVFHQQKLQYTSISMQWNIILCTCGFMVTINMQSIAFARE